MTEFESARNTRTILLAVVVIVVVVAGGVIGFLFLGGQGPTDTTNDTEPSGEQITVLTRHDVAIHNVFEPIFLESEFAQENGITNILWKTPAAEFWDELIDRGEVDVAWGGGPTIFDQLMRDGRLATLDSELMQEVADRVPDQIAGANMKRNDTEDNLKWMAAAISTFGFTVNNQFMDEYELPIPKKWTDLENATYGSLLPTIPTIAMGNAPDTTSNTRIYEIITQGLGWDSGWQTMARMAGSANIYGGSVETQAASENGDVGISMSIDFYGYLTQYRNPDCEYIIPEGQTIVNGDPIAITNNAPNQEYAEGFLDFVMSCEGQALWLDPSIRRMPVLECAFWEPGAEDAQDLYAVFNQTVDTEGIDFNDTLSLQINAAFTKYFESVFTNAHTELVDTWSLLVSSYLDGDLTEGDFETYANMMGTPVTIVDPDTSEEEKFTTEYAIEINEKMIYDADFASTVQSLWTAAAKAAYQDVYNQVSAMLM